MVEADGELIGTAEYHAMPGGEEAEVAFAVTDLHQHEGIGTLLLEDLALIARAAGFRRLVALTLPGNQPMQRVLRTAGLTTRQWFDDGICHVELDLTADHLMQDDSDLRDWRSAVESLRPFLEPTHVVVIGASRDGTGPGHRIVEHLRTSFNGRVSVVHPTAARHRRRQHRTAGRRPAPGTRPGDHRRPRRSGGRRRRGVRDCRRPGGSRHLGRVRRTRCRR